MTAALVGDLVLDVDRRDSGPDHLPHRARDHQLRAEAGVHVHEQGKGHRAGDAAGIFQHVVQGGDAEVRQPEGEIRDTGAREVQRLEAGAFGHECDQCVRRADDLQRRFLGERAAETFTGTVVFHGSDGMPTLVSTSAA